MAFQVEIGIKHPCAVAAGEPFYSSMDFNMLVQVGSLGEAELAAINWALIGSLVGVNPEMVEEVMPFPECFPASFVVTLQDLDESLRFGVLEGVYSELIGGGHVFLYLH